MFYLFCDFLLFSNNMICYFFFFFFKQKTAYEIDMRLEFRRVLFRSQQRLVAERRLELPRFLSAQLGMNGDRAARLQCRAECRGVERNRLVAAAELKRLVF